jgi:glucose-6-phosphate 1-epimerase
MSTDLIQDLNARFAIADQASFAAGPGGFPIVSVRNAHADAAIALQGADVTSFQPHGQEHVLFLSRHAVYAPGKAIRGGIPICWPWFGPHPTDPTKPDHGFARTRPWSVLDTTAMPDGATRVRLGLTDDAATRALWPHAFALELTVTVGATLEVTLVARNTGHEPFVCGGALHSYFRVGDATAITIQGLEETAYVDKVDGGRLKVQQGTVTIAGETDRVYTDTTAVCVIVDSTLGRRVTVAKEGSRSTVVWNPWCDKARRLADLGDDEYTEMVCVEVANAGDDTVTVAPGGEHRLGTTIGAEIVAL